jgi:hypothetical protein
MINLNKTVRYFCAALVLSSALASCGTNAVSQAPTQTVVVTKSQAVQTLERIAAQKGFVGATSVVDLTDGTSSYKVASIERTQDNTTEVLSATEQADGQFQVSSISIPNNTSEVSANFADSITVNTLDTFGKTTDTKKLSDLGKSPEISTNTFLFPSISVFRSVARTIVGIYGKSIGCNNLNQKIRQWTGIYYSISWNASICSAVGM